MLQPLMHVLASKRIILASGSPRRRELLHKLGLDFEVEPSTYDESLQDVKSFPSPAGYVEALAYEKAAEVVRRLDRAVDAPELVVGADTVVTLDGHVYGKPVDKQDAVSMISKFSGRTHHVYTGVAVLRRLEHRRWTTERFSEVTAVTLDTLPPDIVHGYVDTGEPMDKAGGYGIQGLGGTLVSGIDGDYYNVVGLPIHQLCKHLYQMYGSKDGSSER
ncbi:dTTP/UTP pyrophosphatase-like [Pollicipes pollicipes]|uniref:dTTP/UTP pyrophosphatase-like n=1 Tax=Pollicipes pollicipes TaxID=41117 RepID=UPI001884E718|nr:dTTP/UTP pyrophosphatase-like [Pollicipes pollicipes]